VSVLSVGDIAPDFTLEGTEGSFTLSEHRGRRVVLLFYPGDDTTVCTKQFCSYRDAADDVDAAVARAYGVLAKPLRMTKRTVVIVDEEGRIAHRRGNRLSLTFDSVDDLRAALAALD
jgi:peroxiredoxin Q/BCP